MNKVSLLALLPALSLAPAQAATLSQNFTLSSSTVTSSGTITYVTTSTPGVNDVTAITGTFSQTGTGGFSGAILGTVPGSFSAASPSATSNNLSLYDNLLYTSGTPSPCDGQSTTASSLDVCGLEFTIAGGYEVNLYAVNGGSGYLISDNLVTGTTFLQNLQPITFTLSPAATVTPEPSSLLLLGTGALTLAGAARRRFRRG